MPLLYDFDTVVARRGTASVKWDIDADVLEMWVADMDFRTAPEIRAALQRRLDHGVFGYALVPDTYYEATVRWFACRHALQLQREWIVPVTGVIPALAAILDALTSPGDKVLVQTPVYNHFFDSIANSGCEVICSDLVLKDNAYTIDFDDLERKAADKAVKVLLLCNPHNPAGRVWSAQELLRIGDICLRHDVTVLSDEIHCELVMPAHRYTPFASLSEEFLHHSVTCTSPSKAFNLAGLQVANIFVADATLRTRISQALSRSETGAISPFATDALTAAYNEGALWLEALIGYLWENYRFLCDFFARRLPLLRVLPLEGTYLVWIDCRATGLGSERIAARLLEQARLRVNPGSLYGAAGEGFVRLNIACPRKLLIEGLERIARTIGKN